MGSVCEASRLQDGLPPCLPGVRDLPLLVLHGVLHHRLQLNSSSKGHWYCNHFDKNAIDVKTCHSGHSGRCVSSSWSFSAYICFLGLYRFYKPWLRKKWRSRERLDA